MKRIRNRIAAALGYQVSRVPSAEKVKAAEEARAAKELKAAEEFKAAVELRVAEEVKAAVELRVAEALKAAEELRAAKEPKVPNGHFYSPYPDLLKIEKRQEIIFSLDKEILDIDLNEGGQFELLKQMAELYPSIPFTDQKVEKFRYYYDNDWYSYFDAMSLHCMLRIHKPKRLFEVGSGFSSAVALDTNDHFLGGSTEFTFIEPYPEERLYGLLREGDRHRVIVSNLEEVPLSLFNELEAGDFLLIDSSHVSKVDSDVNFIFFEILPRLKKGVHIHFHDVSFPFEYYKYMVFDKLAWTEAYILRAFLANNNKFKVEFFCSQAVMQHSEFVKKNIPLPMTKGPGCNIWIKKVED